MHPCTMLIHIKCYVNITDILHLGTTLALSHLWSLKVFLLWQTYLLLEMPMTLQMTVKNILHLATIFVIWHLWILMFSLFHGHICFCKCQCNVKWQSQIFFIWQSCPFFHIYDHLSIPCFTIIFFSHLCR